MMNEADADEIKESEFVLFSRPPPPPGNGPGGGPRPSVSDLLRLARRGESLAVKGRCLDAGWMACFHGGKVAIRPGGPACAPRARLTGCAVPPRAPAIPTSARSLRVAAAQRIAWAPAAVRSWLARPPPPISDSLIHAGAARRPLVDAPATPGWTGRARDTSACGPPTPIQFVQNMRVCCWPAGTAGAARVTVCSVLLRRLRALWPETVGRTTTTRRSNNPRGARGGEDCSEKIGTESTWATKPIVACAGGNCVEVQGFTRCGGLGEVAVVVFAQATRQTVSLLLLCRDF
jgi:hypothetical protein